MNLCNTPLTCFGEPRLRQYGGWDTRPLGECAVIRPPRRGGTTKVDIRGGRAGRIAFENVQEGAVRPLRSAYCDNHRTGNGPVGHGLACAALERSARYALFPRDEPDLRAVFGNAAAHPEYG